MKANTFISILSEYISIKNIIYLAIVGALLMVTLWALRKARKHYQARGDSPMAGPIFKLLRGAAWLFFAMLGASVVGINIAPIYAAMAGALWGVFSGLAKTINKVANAFIIWSGDIAPIGKSINIDGVKGKVKERTLFYVLVRDSEREEWIIPNDRFLDNKIGYPGGRNENN